MSYLTTTIIPQNAQKVKSFSKKEEVSQTNFGLSKDALNLYLCRLYNDTMSAAGLDTDRNIVAAGYKIFEAGFNAAAFLFPQEKYESEVKTYAK